MATQELGMISEVKLTEIWPDEAQNFTVWLSKPENLQLLGASLGLELEFIGREVPVGPFRLDLLARERESGQEVAIENQLYPSDHSHLGQLMTYAAGRQAQVLIWVASSFTPQHRAAVDWLNQWTQRQIDCYAVEIHAVKIGNSVAAPEFVPVAVPLNWVAPNPRLTIPSRPRLEDSQLYLDFFQPLVDQLNGAGFTNETDAKPDRDQRFPSGLRDWISYYAGFDDDGTWVYLWFVGGRGRRDFSNEVYDLLASQEGWEDIQGSFTGEWWWDQQKAWWYFSVSLRKDGSIKDPPQKLNEIRAWMLETLPKFRDVFNPRLKKILAELETE